MSGSPAGTTVVKCDCGVKIKVPESAAGRRARCPKCGKVFKVPAAVAAAPRIEPALEDSLLDDFAEQEATAEAVERPEASHANVPRPTVMVSPPSLNAAEKSEPGALLGGALAAKSFLTGCAFSAVAAVIGAGIWYGIVASINYEIGWVAWGIGLAAGFGMAAGSRKGSLAGGAVAATMATLSIVVARLLIFNVMAAPVIGNMRVAVAASYLTDQELTEQGVTDKQEREEKFEAVYTAKKERVDRMSEAKFADVLVKAEQAFSEKYGEDIEWPTFFNSSFGWMDLLFFGLAIASAFKLGASGLVGDS